MPMSSSNVSIYTSLSALVYLSLRKCTIVSVIIDRDSISQVQQSILRARLAYYLITVDHLNYYS